MRSFGNETMQRGVVNAHVFQIWDKYIDGNIKIGKLLPKCVLTIRLPNRNQLRKILKRV